ncbi:MAG TPA: GGDEF domain-containing protein [Geminicoccaceae bacterium]|nr:GGDEF domain-containing protein [Geminicoccus sp.]HMU48226.1 GGDEF domain-containing protein [Geminicoccaceae bacterium]
MGPGKAGPSVAGQPETRRPTRSRLGWRTRPALTQGTAADVPEPGPLVRGLLRVVEHLGWRLGTAACLGVSILASCGLTVAVLLVLGASPQRLLVGASISILAPALISTPSIALALRLVDHLAGLRLRLEREVEQRAAAEERLRRLVGEDELTGLGNRRDFLSRARTALAIARRARQSIGILVIDLDHFKEVNDRHGHQIGDEALIRVARLLRRELRATDSAARIGGDEFVALLPQADARSSATAAERIRLAVADDGQEPALTVTIGCVVSGTSRMQLPQLMRAADQALYAAKRAGRNRVFLAGRSGPAAAPEALPAESSPA